MDDRIVQDDDRIIQYLMEQQKLQHIDGEEFHKAEFQEFYEESPEQIENYVEGLVGNLITKVEALIQRNEDYSDKLKAHNQYGLFNMKNVINGFCIDNDLYDKLTFRETLVISRIDEYMGNIIAGKSYGIATGDEPKPMGAICIDVQKGSGSQPFEREDPKTDFKMMDDMEHFGEGQAIYQYNLRTVPEDDLDTQRRREMNKLLVHVSSDFDYYRKNGGSRITSWVDRNLHTLEELRREYLMAGTQMLEEKLLLTLIKPFKYYVKHKDLATETDSRKMYMFSKTKDYISEGANFVLMRYLAITQYIGKFEMSCMYINGDMCRNIYECAGPEKTTLNGRKLDICKVDRTIIEECGVTHMCVTALTINGQIIKQEWQTCNFILHVNPLLKISSDTPPGNDQILVQDYWVDDMQMMSVYLDDKSKARIKMHSYLLDHPELKRMVGDYIQEIISSKPSDVLEYTIDHFLYFSPEYFPRYDFL